MFSINNVLKAYYDVPTDNSLKKKEEKKKKT